MRPGELIANRFRVLERAGAGGMGVVFRAKDVERNADVALKLLHPDQHPERFLREAAVLADLSHPAIVRYVAHGVTASGQIYLAMEWLEGTDLSRLIAQRRLGYSEVLLLLKRICGGLSEAHEKGVVHRDLKPANIILPAESPAAAKVIDFGIARRRLDPRITERGLLVGTISYMSPEQARGLSELAPSSDVFSVASLVYKAMTGQPPFGGGDPTAVLAKVLLEEPPPLSELAPGVPHSFDELLEQMLKKSAAERLPDARAVLDVLESLDESEDTSAATRVGITLREQRVVWVVMLGGARPDDTETAAVRASLLEVDPEARLAAAIMRAGGRYDVLADGTRVASFVGGGVPRDESLRSVRIAQTMQDLFPGRPIAIASGLGVVGSRAPLGDAIDRGAHLLSRATEPVVYLDDGTADLVAGFVDLLRDAAGCRVRGIAADSDSTRRLLGRPTSCVGRDRELATLDALLDECVEERVARVALVVAPAGMGKSRLRYEFLRRAAARHADIELLLGRAESVSAGSPFAQLRHAIRRSAGIIDGDTLEVNQAKISERVLRSRRLGETGQLRTTVFLAELAGVPFPDTAYEPLKAIRQNPTLLGDAMRGAWLDFLARESETHPVLLVLEDVHWGDLPTTSFVDAALATLADSPLFVLALARPEIHDVFPSLWARREPQEVRLAPVCSGVAEEMVREVLGTGVSDATCGRIVELADGNAFFLEELIRAVAEGHSELPSTVMSMMQARLDSLSSQARLVLRAASVFGAQFWRGGVTALLGDRADEQAIDTELDELVTRELVTKRASTALVGDTEYVFRHAVLHETVYATLTSEDRRLGHALAAEWLEQSGSADAVAMAEHFERAEQRDRAARWYLTGAQHALEGVDLAGVIERVERALACGPDEAMAGELHGLAADAHFWRGDYEGSEQHAQSAVNLLTPGEPRWFLAVSVLCSSAGTLGKDQEILAWASRAAAHEPSSDEARAAQVVSLVRASHGYLKLGLNDAANTAIERVEHIVSGLTRLVDMGRAWLHHAKSARAYYAGNVVEFLQEVEQSIEAFDLIGDWRTGANAKANFGYALLSVGDIERAERALRAALDSTERLGIAGIGHYVMHNLGLVLAYRGKLAEGERLERQAVTEAESRGEKLLASGSHVYLALILLLAGRAEEAETEARLGAEAAPTMPILQAQALAAESQALRAQGKLAEALAKADAAWALLEARGGSDETEFRVRWARADALWATSDRSAAVELARAAAERLRDRARSFGDAHVEQCFLHGVPEHHALLELSEGRHVAQA